MSANSLSVPFPIFNDIDGDPLDAGYIYIGTANLDPVTNPISVYFDEALTVPAAQPIRTLNGFPSNSGTPARLYVDADNYSITVKNKNGSQVYTSSNTTERFPSALVTLSPSGLLIATFNSVDDMIANSAISVGVKVRTLGYYVAGDGGGNDYEIVSNGTGTADGGSFIDLSGISGQAKGLFVDGKISIDKFGASLSASASDNFSALNNAIEYALTNGVGVVEVPKFYNIGNNKIEITNHSQPAGASLTLRGKSVGNATWKDDSGASGFASTAQTMLGFNASSPCTLDLILENLRFEATPNTTLYGLDFENASQNIQVTLKNVAVTKLEGASTIGIRTGDAVDSTWNNVYIVGYNTQPNIGLYVSREAPTYIGGAIKYCKKSVFIGPAELASIKMTSVWMLVPSEVHIYVEDIGISNARRAHPSHFVNCFIGEIASTSARVLYDNGGVSSTQNFIAFTGCQFDMASGATISGFELTGSGGISFDNCDVVNPTANFVNAPSAGVVCTNPRQGFIQTNETGVPQGDSYISVHAPGLNSAMQLQNGTGYPLLSFKRSAATVREGGIGFRTGTSQLDFGAPQSGILLQGTAVAPCVVADNNIAPQDNAVSLGNGSYRWSVVYSATGTINTSDAREKTFLNIADAEKTAALEIKANLRKFKFNDAIDAKGDSARIHFGASAQQVGEILANNGLNPEDYAFYCYDEWDAQFDEEGNETGPAGNRYGIRYEELLSFILVAL